ncbi:MAG TPA: anti-sigma factor [Pseudomonadota bacterium]|jgi:hypothetical protein|nr:anti-sigma factor [Pseudomonadota bacterium]HNF97045.1 anti-sigma factor [Pseudomonadota bacterium]HNI59232.1 anti-sigma factor [Pseudomonadota bacterium]HNK43602.1 anti-sigma factor [Pseudomonadota bacterium]HNN49572.1 anti-sigma factor [Pseudomonadota bacterium]
MMKRVMWSCRDLTSVATDYLEGRLTFGQRLQFWLHLGICLGCRRYLQQMRTTIALLGQLSEEPLPPEIESGLLKQFHSVQKH